MRREEPTTVLADVAADLAEALFRQECRAAFAAQRDRVDLGGRTVPEGAASEAFARLDADVDAARAIRVLARAFAVPRRDVAVAVALRVALLRGREREIRERNGRGHA